MLGDGKCMPVGLYGNLDLALHRELDVRVTLTNDVVVPGLALDIMSFNRTQERHEIVLNRAEASILGGRVWFKKFRAGNFIHATRVPHDDARPQPPAMVAAMMRPGPPSSMNVNDFHNPLGHAKVPVRDHQADGHQANRDSGVLRLLCRGEGDQAYCSQGRRLPSQVLASLSTYLHGPGR